MGNSAVTNSVIRFFLLLLIQVFLLQQIGWGWDGKTYLFILLYPLFIAFLPLRLRPIFVMLLGFLLGVCIDFFYETLGLHAAALVFTGFIRGGVLAALEPRDGYSIKANPSRKDLGLPWQLRYLALLFLGHCIFFFIMQSFSLVFWRDILLKTLFTFPVSYLLAVIVTLIFNPRT